MSEENGNEIIETGNETAGDGNDADDHGAEANDNGSGGGGQQQGSPPPWIFALDEWSGERPEDVPAPVWNKDAGGVDIRLLMKRTADAQTEVRKIKDAAKPPKSYAVNLSDELREVFPIDEGHPLTMAVFDAFKETGASQKTADAVLAKVAELYTSTALPDYERDRLARGMGVDAAGAEAEIDDLTDRAKAIAGARTWKAGSAEEARAALDLLCSTAVGCELMRAAVTGELARIAGSYAGSGGDGAGKPKNGGLTEADLKKLMASREYLDGDPAIHAKVDAGWAALHPGASQ